MHPLHKRRKPGPLSEQDEASFGVDHVLEEAHEILARVDDGTLVAQRQREPHQIPLKPNGTPRRRLTLADEQLLAARVQETGDIEARNILVLANIGFVHQLAQKMKRPTSLHEDLFQEGMLGLLRATETYDPTRGWRFNTYAQFWIRAKIQRFLARTNKEEMPPIDGAEPEQFGALRKRPCAWAISIDELMQDDEHGDSCLLTDHAESPETVLLRREARSLVVGVVADVCKERGDERWAKLAEHRVLAVEPETLEKSGARIGLTREGARLHDREIRRRVKRRLSALAP